MNLKCSYIVFITFSLFISDALASERNIQIAAPYITSLIESDHSGIYQKILNEALESVPVTTEQHFFPYKRALHAFKNSKVDCIYSFTQVLEKELGKNQVISSFPLGAFGYYMFTIKGSSPLTSPDQLLGLNVGAVIGHDSYYKHKLNKHTKLQMVGSDEQNIKMLAHKRLDAMIGALPDLTPYVDQLSYSPAHPLVKSYDRVTCHNTPYNQAFIDALSTSLRALKANGSYKKIAKELYLEFDDSTQ